MTAVPPPYAPRDHAQVQPSPSASTSVSPGPAAALEFNETTSVTLEWRITGMKATYDQSRGDAKSKCIKSAVFGDADNLWEVLWYPNSGVQGGEYASLYLSCVPTAQERDQGLGNKWTRKGLWWFRFEIKSTIPDDRTGKVVTLATKDASDHTFAVKTANWGWQQFAKRDQLFLHNTVLHADSVLVVCTIQAQPQPPAGWWLGLGLPPRADYVPANTVIGGRNVGSGGGLSSWAGGDGASGGVAGGTAAGGGVKRVVPRDLVNSVGALLDDQLYSDVEFIISPPGGRRRGGSSDADPSQPKRIYAAKKLLVRCEYFESMFNGGFREVEGVIEDDDSDEEMDVLSDSDVEDEVEQPLSASSHLGPHLTTTTSRASSTLPPRRRSMSADIQHAAVPDEERGMDEDLALEDTAVGGEGHADESMEDDGIAAEVQTNTKREITPGRTLSEQGVVMGPKKTRVVVRDAAWSTWWAILYYLYTDTIYFAPLSSSFAHGSPTSSSSTSMLTTHSRPGSMTSAALPAPLTLDLKTRQQWIQAWSAERGMTRDIPGPRPVSAKAVYRLADKLDLQALKLRAFQHIVGGLTAQNIPAEVFSRFSSTFEHVRKVQVAFFLKHWSEIKKSETMGQIWQQIRLGKHAGFEEVWPFIIEQLDYRSS
ncbi:hypothetical protein BCR39DRAFT_539919 [Naematelia encephala]|uniref:MATH domain-containing protein n=1 Tax=Naematelia encephala TaxID=71784 RepID=A0A1Y2AWE0_9TREE|nr:hypothetical protein BCR39DRAFT_539919 [Naematelia encephala]